MDPPAYKTGLLCGFVNFTFSTLRAALKLEAPTGRNGYANSVHMSLCLPTFFLELTVGAIQASLKHVFGQMSIFIDGFLINRARGTELLKVFLYASEPPKSNSTFVCSFAQ